MLVNRRFGASAIIFLNIYIKLAFCNEISNGIDGTEKKYIYKCCPESLIVYKNECFVPTDDINIDFSDIEIFTYYNKNTGLKLKDVYQIRVLQDYLLNETAPEYQAEYFLTEEVLLSKLSIPNAVDRWHTVSREDFCLDYEMIEDENVTTVQPVFRFKIAAFDQDVDLKEFYIKAGALLVSCLFLIIVLLVYCILPQLQNLGGKVLMAYAVSLICAYALLASIIIITESTQQFTANFCVSLSAAIYFFFMASFFWMNVMSWDLWKSFSRMADFRHPNFDTRPSMFRLYSLYAWGLPFCMTIMFVVFNQYQLPGVIGPNIPKFGCFIDEPEKRLYFCVPMLILISCNWVLLNEYVLTATVCVVTEPEKRLYFYVPMLILISCNWVLFLLTAFNLWRFNKSSKMVNKRNSCLPAKHNATRQQFTMYLKFSLMMGISFILEATSSQMPYLSVWYITDMYNMLIGVAFFIIFVCKRRILRMLRKKLKSLRSSKTNFGKVVNIYPSKAAVYNYEMSHTRV